MSEIAGALEVSQYKACFLGCESLGDLPLNPTLFPFGLKFHCFSAELIWQPAAVTESCEAALPIAARYVGLLVAPALVLSTPCKTCLGLVMQQSISAGLVEVDGADRDG